MPRYKLILEYDGTGFVGWQRQDNGLAVQAVLEAALEGFCGETVATVAAGRTDAGVHARGQVVHADLPRDFPPATVMNALNYYLRPAPVAVLACTAVDDDFHARFSATRRHYLYRILNRRAPPALDADRVWHVVRPLDAAAMHAAAQALVGRHDFSSFRAAQCQARSPVKTLDALVVERAGEEVRIATYARSFLHNQVRAMVGSLKLVGEGKWRSADLEAALAARNRQAAGPNAPPCGLYLMRIDY